MAMRIKRTKNTLIEIKTIQKSQSVVQQACMFHMMIVASNISARLFRPQAIPFVFRMIAVVNTKQN